MQSWPRRGAGVAVEFSMTSCLRCSRPVRGAEEILGENGFATAEIADLRRDDIAA
jgi:hypothetical protein